MVDIMLATYNGDKYLPELLASLEGQSERDIAVLCRDDGSVDGTGTLLDAACTRDGRFRRVFGPPTGSPSGCFFALLSASEAPYAMFCDQDDVWRREKVERTLAAMRASEARWGRDMPILVHTDAAVAEASGRVTAPSLMALQRLHPERGDLPRLLCQSLVTGCTVMINAPLRSLVLAHLPERCLMYDWWISLAAAALGRIVYLPEATLDYRQHGDNQVGAKDVAAPGYVLEKLRQGEANRRALADTCEQAAAFAAAFRELLPEETLALAEDYAALPALPGKAERIHRARRLGTLKCGFLRRCGQLWYL